MKELVDIILKVKISWMNNRKNRHKPETLYEKIQESSLLRTLGMA